MTVVEMIESVRMGVDKTASFETASFEEEEILYWLNEAQLELAKQKMFGNNYRREGYDDLYYKMGDKMHTKRSDDLSNLIRYSEELTYYPKTDITNSVYPNFRPHAYHPNIAVVNIHPNNTPHYLFYIGADFKVTENIAPMETQVIEQSEIGKLVETPTNKPYLKNGYIYLKEGEVNVIYDPYVTPEWLYISYLMEPKKMVTDTPGTWETDYTPITTPTEENTAGLWPDQVHQEIVMLTVNMMLENIADPRYKSHSIELNKIE